MAKTRVTVIGAGAWGTTVANLLAKNCTDVYLWASQPAVVEDIRRTRQNAAYLPGVTLRGNVVPFHEVVPAPLDSPLIVWAIPVQFLRARLGRFVGHLPRGVVCVNLGKGIEVDTLARPSEILLEECAGLRAVGSLAGPNIASEVAQEMYTEMTLALSDYRLLGEVAGYFAADTLRVHLSADLTGLELSAALKNVCAVAAGVCDGLRLGANTKGLVLAAGLNEMRRIGAVLGANPESFLTGCTLGDVLASCYSESGRNRRVGEYLGAGKPLQEALRLLNGRVSEGVPTCQACRQLQARLGLTLPLVESVHELLEGLIDADTCIRRILRQARNPEQEGAPQARPMVGEGNLHLLELVAHDRF